MLVEETPVTEGSRLEEGPAGEIRQMLLLALLGLPNLSEGLQMSPAQASQREAIREAPQLLVLQFLALRFLGRLLLPSWSEDSLIFPGPNYRPATLREMGLLFLLELVRVVREVFDLRGPQKDRLLMVVQPLDHHWIHRSPTCRIPF